MGLVQRLPGSCFDTGKATGGLTAAIALRHQGMDVLEQAELMAEIGAGIQIVSNAAIVLRRNGP